jgi:hypothetical protein
VLITIAMFLSSQNTQKIQFFKKLPYQTHNGYRRINQFL